MTWKPTGIPSRLLQIVRHTCQGIPAYRQGPSRTEWQRIADEVLPMFQENEDEPRYDVLVSLQVGDALQLDPVDLWRQSCALRKSIEAGNEAERLEWMLEMLRPIQRRVWSAAAEIITIKASAWNTFEGAMFGGGPQDDEIPTAVFQKSLVKLILASFPDCQYPGNFWSDILKHVAPLWPEEVHPAFGPDETEAAESQIDPLADQDRSPFGQVILLRVRWHGLQEEARSILREAQSLKTNLARLELEPDELPELSAAKHQVQSLIDDLLYHVHQKRGDRPRG